MSSNRTKLLAIGGGLLVVLAVAGGAGAVVATGDDDDEQSITGTALERASEAALDHTGGGRVTDTEVGDEESLYEVEVTLDNGDQVDVQLDENFTVVGDEADDAGTEGSFSDD